MLLLLIRFIISSLHPHYTVPHGRYLVDDVTDELWTRVAHGMDAFRMPSTEGIAGHVATNGDLVNIPECYDDDRCE